MTSKHNRNKIKIEEDNLEEKSHTSFPPADDTDSEVNEDSHTSETIKNLDWNYVIKKTTGDFDATTQ